MLPSRPPLPGLPLRIILIVGLASSLRAAPFQGEGRRGQRLNGPLPLGVVGMVRAPVTISPDGTWTVFLAEDSLDGLTDLFSAPTDGSAPAVRLHPALSSTEYVQRFTISPDSSRVLYATTGQDGDRLSSVPIDGSQPPVQLDPDRVGGFEITSDSTRVIYSGGSDVRSVPIDGSQSPTVLALNGQGIGLELTDQGDRALFATSELVTFSVPLFSVPTDASTPPVQLSPAPTGVEAETGTWRISPDGARCAFTWYEGFPGVSELWGCRMDGSAPAYRLNGPIVSGANVSQLGTFVFEIDATGTHVVYRADAEVVGRDELYSVDLATGTLHAKLSAPLVTGGDVTDFVISPSGAEVLYRADALVDGVFGLFLAPIDGSVPAVAFHAPSNMNVGGARYSSDGASVLFEQVGLSGSPLSVGLALASGAQPPTVLTPLTVAPRGGGLLLPDASGFLFRAGPPFTSSGLEGLYRVPTDGSQVLSRLDAPLQGFNNVTEALLAPDGARAVYRADPIEDGREELFSVPTDDSAPPTRLSGDLAPSTIPFGDVHELRVTSDGAHVVYQAQTDDVLVTDLLSVPADGSGPPLKLNDPVTWGGCAFDYTPVDDGRVLYRQSESNQGFRLRVVPVDRSTPPLDLTGPSVGNVSFPFRVTPDASLVLFRGNPTSGVHRLFSVLTDGSQAPVALHAPLSSPQDVFEWRLSPDGSLAVFAADLDTAGKEELYAVPSDGSGMVVKLNAPLPTGGDVFEPFFISSDRAVYAADQNVAGRVELFSVPLDGSTAPVRLSGTLVANGDVVAHLLDRNAQTALYLADQAADERFELYAAPVDGSQAALRMNGTLVAGGDVLAATFDPQGTWAVYLADQLTNDRPEIFSARIDGSQPAQRLNSNLSSGGRVESDFRVTEDGTRVLFRAAQGTTTSFQLFSAPIDGSAAAVRLNPLFTGGRNVVSFRAFGDRVLYAANQRAGAGLELFMVPQAGGRVVRVTAPFAPTSEIWLDGNFTTAFELEPSGRVFYLADQDTDTVVELYTSITGPLAVPQTPLTSPLPVRGASAPRYASGNAPTWSLGSTPDGRPAARAVSTGELLSYRPHRGRPAEGVNVLIRSRDRIAAGAQSDLREPGACFFAPRRAQRAALPAHPGADR